MAVGWSDDIAQEQRRRLRQTLLLSLVFHLVLLSSLYLTPPPRHYVPPPALQVELLAALPAPPPKQVEPQAKPAPVVPAPPPKPQVKLLPKKAPPALPKQTPKPKSKPERTPDEMRRRPKPQELKYDDALAKLRQELGETAPARPAPQVAKAEVVAPEEGVKGIKLSPEEKAWRLAVQRRIRSVWITPPEFRESGLATELSIELAIDGRVIGEPEVIRSSGNPFYDDNAKRAILKSSPLPAPPKAGKRSIIFTPEE